jgi:hypothetical protein
MKKLLAVAIATTISATSMADISITGDAEFNYDHNNYSLASSNDLNQSDMEVNLNIVGKAGDTRVIADVVLGGIGNQPGNSGAAVEDLYMTTKLGPVSAKVGNYTTATTALLGEIDNGGRQNGKMTFSYTTNGIKFYAGNNGNSGTAGTHGYTINNNMFAGVVANVEGWKLQLKKNGSSSGSGATENDNIAAGIWGKAGPVEVRFEYKDDNRADSDVWFLNLTGSIDNIKLGLAHIDADQDGLISENDSSIFAVENGLTDYMANSDGNTQLSASIAVDGTTYAAYIGEISSDTISDRDYYKVSAKRTLSSGVTAAVSYTDREITSTNGVKNFSVDLTVKF